jgi:DNA-binding MarR family transcriptional regulator
MDNNEKTEIRHIRNGNWFWINKKVLQLFSRSLKASGIAVYNALASFANSRNQVCFPTQKAIADLIGISKRTVIRRIRQLQGLGLLSVEKKRGRCLYRLLRPKVPKETQGCDKKDTRKVTPGNTNKNYITRINNNNIDNLNFHFLKSKTFKGFIPKTREELLALDIARELKDPKALPLYLSYARKYPESLLRKVLGEVKEIPIRRIKKGRAALFNYLIKKYAQEASKNHRH